LGKAAANAAASAAATFDWRIIKCRSLYTLKGLICRVCAAIRAS